MKYVYNSYKMITVWVPGNPVLFVSNADSETPGNPTNTEFQQNLGGNVVFVPELSEL